MSVFESIRVALGMLRTHKMRSFLTMLGVIIGVMSVSLIVLVSSGFKSFIEDQFSGLSADTIFISYNPQEIQEGEALGGIEGLTDLHLQLIREQTTKVGAVTPVYESVTSISAGENEAESSRVRFIEAADNQFSEKILIEGRLISPRDVESSANVVMLYDSAAEKLFPGRNSGLLGERVNLDGLSLEVIGVVEQKEIELGPGGDVAVVEVPITTGQSKLFNRPQYDYVMAKPAEGATIEEAMDDIWQVLMTASDNKRVFMVDSAQGIIGVFTAVIGVAGVVLAGIAALSLLVGGIGIMNIMLVSVTERTREIGLRKAVGAKRSNILVQFLVEAGMLSLVGGLIGMALAWGLGKVVQMLTAQIDFPSDAGLAAPFPLLPALAAMAFSALIGMVFGFFPAVSAARLEPIVALRTE